MDSYDSRLSSVYREALSKKIEAATEALVRTPSPDFASYKQSIGHIKGMSDALALLNETQENLGRDKPTEEKRANVSNRYEQ